MAATATKEMIKLKSFKSGLVSKLNMVINLIIRSLYYLQVNRYTSRVLLLPLSIITSNVCQIISVMKTKTLVFPEKWYFKNSSFWFF